jgi:catechol 2,3-dioxygenase-like lactoylglutathione lyase family enzyme
MTRPVINGIAPFFIVRNAAAAVAFYSDKLGFDVMYQEPEDDPFFAIVCRGSAMLMVKGVEVDPLPNPARDAAARWDAYISVPDPDALAEEFTSRGVIFSVPLKDTDDGLRGFELKDADGYVLFFGRPRENSNAGGSSLRSE